MADPITADIHHRLGKAGARERIGSRIGELAGMIPGGAEVDHHWEGDTMHFTVAAMGQRIASTLEVMDEKVRATVDLPPFLALFAGKIREKLQKDAPKLLR